jgi:hypothetical protein
VAELTYSFFAGVVAGSCGMREVLANPELMNPAKTNMSAKSFPNRSFIMAESLEFPSGIALLEGNDSTSVQILSAQTAFFRDLRTL